MTNPIIFYADGSIYDGEPVSAPQSGVQIIKLADGKILRPADYYLWRPSLQSFTEHVDAASVILAASQEIWVRLLTGSYIPNDQFKEIVRRAQEAHPDSNGTGD